MLLYRTSHLIYPSIHIIDLSKPISIFKNNAIPCSPSHAHSPLKIT